MKKQNSKYYAKAQSQFYDKYPPIVPWPQILANKGFSITYKPREVFWKSYLDKILTKNQKVLDIGCGQGLTLKRMAVTYKVSGVGIDVSKESIKYANDNFGGSKLKYVVADATFLPFKNNSFDVVVSFDALEHIKDQEMVIKEALRVLNPGGKLLIYTMSKNYDLTLDWFWEKLDFDIFKRAAHTKKLFVDPYYLKNLLEKKKTKILKLDLYDAFFTLGLDESIMIDILVWKKLGFDGHPKVGRVILGYYNFISRILYPLLNFLDGFWYRKERSLSFIVVGEKKV